jgi:hypothetical protein
MQADGRIMVGSSAFNTVRLGRLNTNGSWDNSFHAGTGPDGAVLFVGLQPNGHVLIGGDFLLVNGVGRPHVARLLGDTPSPLPSLRIGRSSSFVTISWPLVGAFVLDQSLTLPGNWSQVLPPYTTNGNSITVSVSTPVGNKFYRLRRP